MTHSLLALTSAMILLAPFQRDPSTASGAGPRLAEGFVLEPMFSPLFKAGDTPLDLCFDADGVPFVLLQRGTDGERAVLRVDDPGQGRHAAKGHVVASAPRGERPDLSGWGIEFHSWSDAGTRTWDGAEFRLDARGALIDTLLPEAPLLPSAGAALVVESARWPDLEDGAHSQLLVADADGRTIHLHSLTERGRSLDLGPAQVLVQAREEGVFQATALVLGPDALPWIIDTGARGLWRLRPVESSTQLGPVLSGAHGTELLIALRHRNAERRSAARALILARKAPVQAQDRALAVLDALHKELEPFAAASIDRILATRGAALPRSEPKLDGGVRERLERHQVRLDVLRGEPLAARRLLPRWLECNERTRLVLARVLSKHPAATTEERSLTAAALGQPESTTRYVALLDPLGSVDDSDECGSTGEAFLHHLAPLGVEYVETVHSLDELFPRLASAHTLVLASLSARYTPLWRDLIDAHIQRGGGVLIYVWRNHMGEFRSPEGEWEPELVWKRDLASLRLARQTYCIANQSRTTLVSDLPALTGLPRQLDSSPMGTGFALSEGRSSRVLVHVIQGQSDNMIVSRDLGAGRVVTYAFAFGCVNFDTPQEELLLRTFVAFAGEGRADDGD